MQTPEPIHKPKSLVINPAELVTIARYDQMLEAGIVKGLLMSAEIPVQLADVHIGNTYGVVSQMFGGIRLQVPQQYVAEAQQLLEDYAAGRLAVEETQPIANEEINQPPEPMPALWHPDWAAVNGIILSPVFPMLLHYFNWRSLNNARQAGLALRWLVVSLTILLGIPTYSFLVTGNAQTSKSLVVLAWWVLLLIWYFSHGRAQAVLMQKWIYPKKLMGLAMLMGAVCLIGLNMGAKLVSTHLLTLPMRISWVVKEMSVATQGNEKIRQMAVSQTGTTLQLTTELTADFDQFDPEEFETLRASNTKDFCASAFNTLIEQGMTLEINYVNLAKQPLGVIQISAKDCAEFH